MRKTKVKKENPPVRLLGTMFLLVLGLVAVYVVLALGILRAGAAAGASGQQRIIRCSGLFSS